MNKNIEVNTILPLIGMLDHRKRKCCAASQRLRCNPDCGPGCFLTEDPSQMFITANIIIFYSNFTKLFIKLTDKLCRLFMKDYYLKGEIK